MKNINNQLKQMKMNKKPTIWCLIKEHWGYNLLYVLKSAVIFGVTTFSVFALGKWIGSIIEFAKYKSNVNVKNTFYLWTMIGIGSIILKSILWIVNHRYTKFLDIKNSLFLSRLISTKITSLEYQKFNQRTVGNYLSWYENDLEQIKTSFIEGFYRLIDYFFSVIFIIPTLFITNWIMAIIIIVIFILINLIPKLFRKSLEKINLNNSQLIEIIYSKIQKALDLWTFFNFKNLRNKFFEQFTQGYRDLRNQSLKRNVQNLPYELLLKILFVIGLSSTFIIAIILKKHNLINITVITTALLLSQRLFSRGLDNVSLLLKFNSIKKIYDKIFDLPNSLIPLNDVINETGGFHQINIKNVSYQYQDQNEKVIEKFSYQFDRGKKYLIMAPSGYGKSTLVKIMAGLCKDYEGNVLWNNNQELKLIDDQLLRKYISYVDNNNYILEDESFETNITMWSEFNQERFNRIVKLLAINNLKGHFDHHKNALSEGQKQKISMARMLYENKPIIFLDEALDNIDQNYKEKLIKVFQNLASWKTLVVVTHNMKPEHRLIFDEVIYLDQLRS